MGPLDRRKSERPFVEKVTFSSKWRRRIRRIISAQSTLMIDWRRTMTLPPIGTTRRFSRKDFVWKRRPIAPARSPVFTRSWKRRRGRNGHGNSFGFTRLDLMPVNYWRRTQNGRRPPLFTKSLPRRVEVAAAKRGSVWTDFGWSISCDRNSRLTNAFSLAFGVE